MSAQTTGTNDVSDRPCPKRKQLPSDEGYGWDPEEVDAEKPFLGEAIGTSFFLFFFFVSNCDGLQPTSVSGKRWVDRSR